MFQQPQLGPQGVQRATRQTTLGLADANVRDGRSQSTSGNQHFPHQAASTPTARLGDLPPATPNPQPRVLFWEKDAGGLEEHPKIVLGAVDSRRPPAPIGCSGCCARLQDLQKPPATRHANLGNRRPQTESPSENRTPPARGLGGCVLGSTAWLQHGWMGLRTNRRRRKSKWNPLLFWAGCWPTSPRQEPDGCAL